MKIAVASSGLGHVSRGMEAWAEALAAALYEQGINVTLFRGAAPKHNSYDVVIPCIKRTSRPAQIGKLLNYCGGWRVGLGSEAAVESFSFGVQLLRHLRTGYDLVHVQQGSLAIFLQRAAKLGLLKCPVVFGNGQKGDPQLCQGFNYLHFLSPHGMKEVTDHVEGHPFWRVIPNFIDTEVFSPSDKKSARRKSGLPEDGLIILSVGMVDKTVKRMDYFIRESAQLAARLPRSVHVVIAGSPHKDSREIENIGRTLLGKKLHMLYEIQRERMPDLYRAADIFALCSPREALGMAIIEAMACGVPAVCHQFPVMQWVIGDGGISADLTLPGALCKVLEQLSKDQSLREKLGRCARERAVASFSKTSVIKSILQMYREILFEDHSHLNPLSSMKM